MSPAITVLSKFAKQQFSPVSRTKRTKPADSRRRAFLKDGQVASPHQKTEVEAASRTRNGASGIGFAHNPAITGSNPVPTSLESYTGLLINAL